VAGNGGGLLSSAYSGDGGLATNANFYEPTGVGLDLSGKLYAASAGSVVCKVDLGWTPILQLNNIGATNIGNYDVVVTSPYGCVTSSVVSLTVLLPPSITVQPASQDEPIGGAASFSVAVTNYPPFGYQWFTSSGRTAIALPFVDFGRVVEVFVVDPGEGYVSPPQVHFVGGGGSGAVGSALLSSGAVGMIMLTSFGSGYTTSPTIQIDPPTSTVNSVLPGATNDTFAFSPVTSADATNYLVVVTNNYGSVTSSAAGLWAFLPPQNLSAGMNGTNLQVQLCGTPGWTYVLQSATNLTPPINWQCICTNFSDTNGNWSFTAMIPTNLPGCFYRAMAQ